MSYQVKQGNLFGRIGSGFGEGLAGQLPKEVERNRLHGALTEIGNTPNQSLFQQFAALAAAPGSTPQIQQSGAELLRQQAIMQGYKRANQQYRDQQNEIQQQPNINDIVFAQKPGQAPRQARTGELPQQEQIIPQPQGSRVEQAKANPPVASENPAAAKFQPPPAWNQKMNDRAVEEAFETGRATNLPDALAYAAQQERFYNGASAAERERYEYKRGIDNRVNELFDSELQTRLQKQGEETYQDISGDLQLDLKKQARNSVATGEMTPNEAAEYYSKAALDLGKQKSEFKKLANPSLDVYLVPSKKQDRIQSLLTMGNEFAKFGPAAQEEFYKMLTNKESGMGLSPGGAAIIAYPRSKEMKSLINNAKVRGGDLQHTTQQAVRLADDVLKNIKPNDSLLAIVRELYTKYPSFNERAFFDYLNDNREMWPNNPNFAREMEEGISDVLPNWYDMFLFPVYGLSPAHK